MACICKKEDEDLSSLLIKWLEHKITFREEHLIMIVFYALDFLRLLHQNNFYYGDLKPKNILVNT